MKRYFLSLASIFLGLMPVNANDLPTFTLPDVVIYASSDIDTVVNAKQVNIGAAKTVPELLRTTAGLQIQARPNSGGNEDLSVKMRGHDSRHYTVLVDGIPQSMSGVMGGCYVNWNAIPLGLVERIEIIKGAKSVAYGQTEGGVINIITKKSRFFIVDRKSANNTFLNGMILPRETEIEIFSGAKIRLANEEFIFKTE